MSDRKRTIGWLWVTAQMLLLAGWAVVVLRDDPVSVPSAMSIVLGIVGWAVAALGLAAGAAALVRMRLRVTPLPEPRPGAELLTDGIYALVRHPMYGGILMMAFGVSLAVRSLAGVGGAVVLTVFFYAKSNYEERRLRARFASYRAYAGRTRRFLPLPW
jgi:protein-S-isoprenylcysteine O-methyltransferase Ste14